MNKVICTIATVCVMLSVQAQDYAYLRAQAAFSYSYYDSVFVLLPATNQTPLYNELRGKASLLLNNEAQAIELFIQSYSSESLYELARIYATKENADSSLYYLNLHLQSHTKKPYHEIMSDKAFETIYSDVLWKLFWKQDRYTPTELVEESIDYLIEQKEYQKALQLITEVTNPSKNIKIKEAFIHTKLDSNSKAEQIINTISIDDANDLNYSLYLVYFELKNYSESYRYLFNFHHSHIDRIDVLYDLAKLAYLLKNYDVSLEYITLYESIFYADDKAWYLHSAILETQLKYTDALLTIQRAIAINPAKAEYLFARGNIYLAIKQFSSAEYDYNQSLDIDPQLEVYFNRGQARRFQGNLHGACLDYTRSYKLGNSESLYYKNKYCK